MARITLDNISKNFGSVQIIKNINLEIADGEFTVFVGPSGCGKSTLLRMIAGLEDVSDGTLAIDGRRVNDLPPKARGVAMVFQNYAIFPHMSVRENIAFGLTIAGASKEEKAAKVAEAAEMLALEPLLDRRPSQLSGGQRQRVAIGRAIVRHPKVFLFDEPLSNLDAALRMDMRMEIAQLHARLGATMIYVTHDQVEAMTLADKIVVLKDGQIQQIGAPMDLWHNPANEFVAGFIGAPAMNFMAVDIVNIDGAQAQIGADAFGTIAVPLRGRKFERGQTAKLGIRPHYLTPIVAADHGAAGSHASLKGQVTLVERLGSETVLAVSLENGTSLLANLSDDMLFNRGDTVTLTFDPARCHLFPL